MCPAASVEPALFLPGHFCFSPGSSQFISRLWLRRNGALPLSGEAPLALARTVAPAPPPADPQVATRASRLGAKHLGVPLVDKKSPFLHDRLFAYEQAIAFYRIARAIRVQLPRRGLGDLADELFRASGSICRNLAEGAASYGPDQKRRYFRIALGSAGECACILDQLEIEEAAPVRLLAEGRARLTSATLLTVGLVR